MNLIQKAKHVLFGSFAATETSPHRRPPTKSLKNTDDLLTRQKRKYGTATAREEESNSALLGWMIRKHLDYVSRFAINFRTGNDPLDREVKGLLDWHHRRKNFDVAGRLNRNQWMRIFERNKVMSGDAFGLMLRGGKLQGLDSSQVAKPQTVNNDKLRENRAMLERTTSHGLVLNDVGAVEFYCICRRNKHGRLEFDHFEPAANVLADGYFTEFAQTRAPSPLLSALNDVIDLNDIKLYTKINLKLKNIFGLAIMRGQSDPLGTQEEDADGNETDAELSAEQVNILDLDQEDKVQMLENNSPGQNSMDFMSKLTQIVMLALDIPYTSFDSSKASFSARIGDRAEYEESAEGKREKNADVLREIYAWRVTDWYNNNDQFRQAADQAGMTAGQIVNKIDIIPAGTPWLDKLNEVKGDILSVALGLESIPRLARKRGVDVYQVGAEQAEYLQWAEQKGLPVFYASGGQDAVQNILNEDTGDNDNGNE